MLAFKICKECISNLLQFSQTTLWKLKIFILEHFDTSFITLICNNSRDINFHFVPAQPSYYSLPKKYPWYFQSHSKKLNLNIDEMDRMVQIMKFQASITSESFSNLVLLKLDTKFYRKVLLFETNSLQSLTKLNV